MRAPSLALAERLAAALLLQARGQDGAGTPCWCWEPDAPEHDDRCVVARAVIAEGLALERSEQQRIESTKGRIDTMYAALMTTDDGEVVAVRFDAGHQCWVPFVSGDEEHLGEMVRIAQVVAQRNGHPLQLVRFYGREDLETIRPEGGH